VSAAAPARAGLLLWLDTAHDAPANMARDAALLERAAGGADDTVLRLFRFAPPGITLGRSQDPARELELERLERAGVRWARRPTGGRAIWHDEEWTFSLATRLGPGGWASTPAAAYERTARLLASALARLGVPAELSPGTRVGAPRVPSGAAPPCFASTARHELTLGGRKLAGIAQRVHGGALLQQGSLLLGGSHAELARWVRADDATRTALADALRAASADAGAYVGADRSLARFEDALAAILRSQVSLTRAKGERGATSLALGAVGRRAG
jgi:lipoate-protein ligase A